MEKKIINVIINTTSREPHSLSDDYLVQSFRRLKQIWTPYVVLQLDTHFEMDSINQTIYPFMKPDDLDNNPIWIAELRASDPCVGGLSELGSCYFHRTFSSANRIPTQLHAIVDNAVGLCFTPVPTLHGRCEYEESPLEEIVTWIAFHPISESLMRICMALTVLQESSRLEGQNAPRREIVEKGNTNELFERYIEISLEIFDIAVQDLKKALLEKFHTFRKAIEKYECLKHEFETDPYYRNLDNATEDKLFLSSKITDIKIPSQHFDHEDFFQTLDEYEIHFHKMFVTIACELDTRIRNAAEYPYILTIVNSACLSAINAIESLMDLYLPVLQDIKRSCEMIKPVTVIKGKKQKRFTTWVRMVIPNSIQTYSKAIDVWVKNIEYTYDLFKNLQSLISTQIPLDE